MLMTLLNFHYVHTFYIYVYWKFPIKNLVFVGLLVLSGKGAFNEYVYGKKSFKQFPIFRCFTKKKEKEEIMMMTTK